MNKKNFLLYCILSATLTPVIHPILMRSVSATEALGTPGATPVWTSARKVGIGTAYGKDSKVWFSLADGIITEVYWPQIDMAQITDAQFLITDGKNFFHEEKKDTIHQVEYLDDKALAYKLINRDKHGRYTLVKEIFTDPKKNTLIMHVTFDTQVKGLRLYLLLNPAVSNTGLYDYAEATPDALYAWDDRAKGNDPLVKQYQALISSVPFSKVSAGFVGTSDGWQDLHQDNRMDWNYSSASNGNVTLMAELSLSSERGKQEFDVVIGFANSKEGAKTEAQTSLNQGYQQIKQEYIKGWNGYCHQLSDLSAQSSDGGKLYYTSAMVLKAHEDKTYEGGMIASLSVPWGTSQNDEKSEDKRGIIPGSPPDGYQDGPIGYHVVWPRDLYQVATAFLAAGEMETALKALQYLKQVQFKEGNWEYCSNMPKKGSFPQNFWLSGQAHWGGLQLDETAMPIILAWRLWKAGQIQPKDYYDSFVKPAAEFILHNGPRTQQERWEENSGHSPSTIAAEIAALVCAADLAQATQDSETATVYLSKADEWASSVDKWTFTTKGLHGKGQYYERIDGQNICGGSSDPNDNVQIQIGNGGGSHMEREILDGGFLELVRFGIKVPDDSNILKTLEVYDKLIRVDIPKGTGFYRYNFDGYGETENGEDYIGTGKGRLWPLLTGERGHYELAHGKDIDEYIHAMEEFANEGRMLPEQVWDGKGHRYQVGEGTGSATPLAWTHAEYIKLLRSKKEGKIYDTPEIVKNRYVVSDWKRTVVFIYGTTQLGQDMFIRGGIDHEYANNTLHKGCSPFNYNCAIPIRHLNMKSSTTAP